MNTFSYFSCLSLQIQNKPHHCVRLASYFCQLLTSRLAYYIPRYTSILYSYTIYYIRYMIEYACFLILSLSFIYFYITFSMTLLVLFTCMWCDVKSKVFSFRKCDGMLGIYLWIWYILFAFLFPFAQLYAVILMWSLLYTLLRIIINV